MEDLVPRPAYDVDETGYWERMPPVVGLFMAICGTFIVWTTVGRECPFLESAIRGMAGGFMFAVLFPLLFRRMIRTYTSKAYAGSGRFATSPPSEFDYTYRLLCSALLGDASAAVGGVLYLGPAGLAFVPFGKAPVLFPIRELTTADVPAPSSWLTRCLIPRPARLLEARAGSARARLVVPIPSTTIARIHRLVQDWASGR